MEEIRQSEDRLMSSVRKIAIPVALQCMLQSSFSIVDQVMIGQLGSTSIAAVGLAGKFASIYSVVVAAVGSVAGIMIAQYLGAKDMEESRRGFTLNLLVATVIGGLFMLLSLSIPEQIIHCYVKDEATIIQAAVYLRIVSMTYLPLAGSTLISTWLRCKEKAYIPLLASLAAVGLNTGLNYILIFGKLGFEPMGCVGAGYATVISQGANFLIMFVGMLVVNGNAHQSALGSPKLQKMTKQEYLLILFPILINEFLWSLGENIYAAIYGHLGTDSVAAMTLTNPIQGLMIGALSGLAGAAGVIIGKQLGKKDYERAYKDAKKLVLLGLVGAIGLSMLLLVLRGFYVEIYKVEESVKLTASRILVAFAILAPVKVLNMILAGGILRSGGDTKTVMYIDLIGTWIFGVPLGLLSAYVFRLTIPWVYLILSMEEVVRLLIACVIFRTKKWMHSI
ncbi:MAG: MATE family efflux transporter [bacterium]|nr:MATE family efflux transporter [bacterium]